MSYSDSLRQQAKWVREAIDDPAPMKSFRFDLGDVDTDELDAAADHIDALVKALADALDAFEDIKRLCAGSDNDTIAFIGKVAEAVLEDTPAIHGVVGSPPND